MSSDQLSLEQWTQSKPSQTGEDPHILSVSELNRAIRSSLEGQFGLIWLKGEISNFKPHSSGHFYFSLKDEKAQISAVMFRGSNSALRFRPEDGMEVVVRGRVTVYEPRGNYQIVCEIMEPVGLGALQMAYEQLKRKLEAEGLFAAERKKPLPAFPQRLVIVTSPTGAAIRDMINVLSRRYRALEVTLIPASVQGVQAPREIVAAIELANRLQMFDVMIVGRGGGSIEDLWSFNDESVVRAIANSKIPTISAVGHEIDFTLADFAADLRAPTPSAAAELVVKNVHDVNEKIIGQTQRLKTLFQSQWRQRLDFLKNLSTRLIDPKRKLQDLSLRCDELADRLVRAIENRISQQKMRVEVLRQRQGNPLKHLRELGQRVVLQRVRLTGSTARLLERKRGIQARLAGALDALSPLRVVERGFSIVTLEGQVVKSVSQVQTGSLVEVQLAEGKISAQVQKIISEKGVRDGF